MHNRHSHYMRTSNTILMMNNHPSTEKQMNKKTWKNKTKQSNSKSKSKQNNQQPNQTATKQR